MCRIYTEHGRPAYIRLCARTRRAGEQLPYSADLWARRHNGCLPASVLAATRSRAKPLVFRRPRRSHTQDVQALSHWAQAEFEISADYRTVTIRPGQGRWSRRAIADRAAEYGWKLLREEVTAPASA